MFCTKNVSSNFSWICQKENLFLASNQVIEVVIPSRNWVINIRTDSSFQSLKKKKWSLCLDQNTTYFSVKILCLIKQKTKKRLQLRSKICLFPQAPKRRRWVCVSSGRFLVAKLFPRFDSKALVFSSCVPTAAVLCRTGETAWQRSATDNCNYSQNSSGLQREPRARRHRAGWVMRTSLTSEIMAVGTEWSSLFSFPTT